MDGNCLPSGLAPVTLGRSMDPVHSAGCLSMGRVWGIRAPAAMRRLRLYQIFLGFNIILEVGVKEVSGVNILHFVEFFNSCF